jgi:hypothetical protein
MPETPPQLHDLQSSWQLRQRSHHLSPCQDNSLKAPLDSRARSSETTRRRYFCHPQGFGEQAPSTRIRPWSSLRIICSSLADLALVRCPYNALRGNLNNQTECRACPRLIVQLISFCKGVGCRNAPEAVYQLEILVQLCDSVGC